MLNEKSSVPSSDEEEDDDGYDNDPEITLDSVERSRTINLSIRATYTNWTPRDAFRELVQNWRDGIIKSFRLAEKDLCILRDAKTLSRSIEIVYKALRFDADDRKECLGFIRFKGHNGEGTIEITNRSASLQPCHLDLGGTSKVGNEHQDGARGVGLKIALIAFMRGSAGHNVRCRSGGFNWKFDFTTSGRLVARLCRMSPRSIHKAEDQARRLSQRRTLLPFATKPNGDVQFVIGETHLGRNEHGNKVKRRPVKQEHFEAWTKAALFLHHGQDGGIISTRDGDLLTDSRLRGNLYLNGFLLRESTPARSASVTNQPLKFGYNLAFGRTNCERQSLASAEEESRAILAIWNNVLVTRPEMASELSIMLNTNEPRYADVLGAKKLMSFETARLLARYLFGKQFEGTWYHCSEEKCMNTRLDQIIQGLGYEGAELTDGYWAILRQYNLIRTAEEEEQRRFAAAPLVDVPESTFAKSVHRLLRACVRACPTTDGMAIRFVQAGQMRLQIVFSEAERLFLVHDRWLSVQDAVMELGLPDDLTEADITFHTVKRLFADALEQLPCSMFPQDSPMTADLQRKLDIKHAEQRLLNHHLLVATLGVRAVPPHHGLCLSWAAPASRQNFEVQCHKASRCFDLWDNLLISEDARPDKLPCIAAKGDDGPIQGTDGDQSVIPPLPTCRVCRQDHRGESYHYERGLEEDGEYFFVLATPSDPTSIVVLSSVTRISAPHPQAPVVAGTHAGSDANIFDGGRGLRKPEQEPETITMDGNISQAQPLFATEAFSATEASASPRTTVPATSFAIGSRVQTVDILAVDRDRWYEAKNSENVRAVIGILNGEKYLPNETRKRRRLHED
ncbi:hypothetical protein MFIFM68171_05784 [Madurella fahalii]|uniref:Uncharacterized protein n=1 Tax=Madurella fahalii TaxID=1157608 RepID=A0ABQ0GCX4_9PEZI